MDRNGARLGHGAPRRPPSWLISLTRTYVRHVDSSVGKGVATPWLHAALRVEARDFIARTLDGHRVEGNTLDLIQRHLFIHGVWQPGLRDWLLGTLHPGDVFIDVGANIGCFTLLASHLVGLHGQVIAIEPSPAAQQRLLRNLLRNGCSNVRVDGRALADGNGKRILYQLTEDNLGSTTHLALHAHPHRTFAVVTAGLGDVVTPEELTRARVIKVDIEGAEATVLRELGLRVDALHPELEVVVEVDPGLAALDGGTAEDVLRPLTSQGFFVYRLDSAARRGETGRAIRISSPITQKGDFVLSRCEVQVLHRRPGLDFTGRPSGR